MTNEETEIHPLTELLIMGVMIVPALIGSVATLSFLMMLDQNVLYLFAGFAAFFGGWAPTFWFIANSGGL